MGDTHHDPNGEHDNDPGELVGTPQADDDTTRGNDTGRLEDPHNGDDDDSDDDPGELDPAAARSLVTKLRKEAGDTRKKLRDAEARGEEYAAELWRYRVSETGLLADPDDLPYDPEALADPDRIKELAEDLVARKPHMRSTRITRRAGQGEGEETTGVSLSSMLRARA